MKKPNINLKSIAEKFLKNLSWLFFAAFLLLIFFEIFEINNSLQIIFKGVPEPKAGKKDVGVRINFDNYNQVVKRIEQSDTFEPTGGIAQDPFNPGYLVRTTLPVNGDSATTTSEN